MLLESQGLGTAIRPISADFQYRYGTTPYSGDVENFQIGTDGETFLTTRNFNPARTSNYIFGSDAEFTYTVWEEDEPIYLGYDTSTPLTNGDGVLDVWFTYKILDL